MDKKKSVFIIVAIVTILAIIIGAVIIMNSQKQQTNKTNNNEMSNSKISDKSKNDIVNRKNHIYGNTDEHNANGGVIVTDDEYWYFAGTTGIKKQKKSDILEFFTEQPLFSVSSKYLNIYKNYLYFLNMDNDTIYRITKDGNERTEIASQIKSFYIIDEYIYYTKYEEEYMSGIYRMTINGDNAELLVDRSVSKFYIYGECLYYIAGDNILAYSDLNGDNESILQDNVSDFKFLGENGILYADALDNNTLYVRYFDNTTKKMSDINGLTSLKLDDVIPNKSYWGINSSKQKFEYNRWQTVYIFISTVDNTIYYTYRGGMKDFEIIGNTMCKVSEDGRASYLNLEGSDFRKYE